MAQINLSFTIPDAKAQLVRDAFAAYHGWTATIDDPANPGTQIPNPEAQGQFIKRRIGEYIKDCVRAHRANQDADAARVASIADTDGIAVT